MGTHCAMTIKDLNNKITRFERTMDGDMLQEEFIAWANRGRAEDVPDPLMIGHGLLEIDNQGEGNEEYYLVLDLPNKQFLLGGDTLSKSLFEAVSKLVQRGWTFIEDFESDLIKAANDPESFPTGSCEEV